MKERLQGASGRRLRFLVGVLISVVLLYAVLRKVDLRETAGMFLSADYPYLVLAALSSVCAFALTAVRWRYILLSVQAVELRLLFSTVMVGFFSNYVLPAKAGELVRVFVLGRHTGVSGSAILATIVLERAFDVLILTVALLGVLFVLPLPTWMGYVGQVAGLSLAGVFAVLLLLLYHPQRAADLTSRLLRAFSPRLASSASENLESFANGLEVLRQRGNLGGAVFFTMASWAVSASTQYLVGRTLGIRADWMAWVLLVALFNLIAIIPSMPGRVGTWELVSIATLGLFGIGNEAALAFPTLLRTAHLLPVALGYMYFSREGLNLLDTLGGISSSEPGPS